MSLSQPKSGNTNPAKKFIKYSSTKSFFYYDKQKEDNVQMPDKFYVIPLDSLATVTGWSDDSMSSIYSNEVRSVAKDELNVRSFKGGEIAKGLWSNIKEKVKVKGGNFTTSMYCALIENGKVTELVNLHLSKSALAPLFDIDLKYDGSILEVSQDPEELKKGSVKYKLPKFVLHAAKPNLVDEAINLDVELQSYLSDYLNKEVDSERSERTSEQGEVVEAETPNNIVEEEIEPLPF